MSGFGHHFAVGTLALLVRVLSVQYLAKNVFERYKLGFCFKRNRGVIRWSTPSPPCVHKGAPSASRSTRAKRARGSLTLTVKKVGDNHTRYLQHSSDDISAKNLGIKPYIQVTTEFNKSLWRENLQNTAGARRPGVQLCGHRPERQILAGANANRRPQLSSKALAEAFS